MNNILRHLFEIITVLVAGIIIYKEIDYQLNGNERLENLQKEYAKYDDASITKSYEENNSKISDAINTDPTKKNIDSYINNLKDEISDLEDKNKEIAVNLSAYTETESQLSDEYNVLLRKKQSERSYLIDNVPTYNQYPAYPTGCESVALYILLKYYGTDVSIEDIVENIKKGKLPYTKDGIKYGGNPYLEFIGDPKKDSSFGTYENAIIEIANKYKSNIINGTGSTLNSLLKMVKENRPVMVWSTINLSLPYISNTWIYEPTGEKISWISGEHAVVIVGYTDDQIIISDPYTGDQKYQDRYTFELRYNYMGKRAVYY